MAATRGDVLAYLQSLTGNVGHRFLLGQHTGWPGAGAPDSEIPPLLAVDGSVTPGLIATIWGEIGVPEDAPHGAPNTVMADMIAGLIAYWNAGSLIEVSYTPAIPAGVDFTVNPWGRFDSMTGTVADHPVNITNLLNGSTTCSQWRAGTLVTGLTYGQVIDYHAVYLAQLRDAGVVVLYRPFPEMDRKGVTATDSNQWDQNYSGADFIALWQFVHDRLVITNGLTNLLFLWACIQSGPTTCLQWYPGSAYVDLVGFDLYPPDGQVPASGAVQHNVYTQLLTLGKPQIFGELGLDDATASTTTPRDLNTFVEQMKARMPQVVGGAFWADVFSLYRQTNVAAGMTNAWVVTQPVPVLQLAPVASFTATPVPSTRTIQFQDTSV